MASILVRTVDHLIQRTLDLHYRLLKEVHPLQLITLEVTNRCNLRCRHCYAKASPESSLKELSLNQIRLLAEELERDFGKISIAITGGEPLLRPDILDILQIFRSHGFPLSLSTNALPLTQPLAEKLAESVSAVSVSIDGLEETHNYIRNADVFRKTLNGIALLRAAGLPYLTVKTTVTSLSLPELSRIESLVDELKVQQWHLFSFESAGRGAEATNLELSAGQYDELCLFVNEAKKRSQQRIVFGEEPYVPHGTKVCDYCKYRRCQAGITGVGVLPDGSVLDCINAERTESRIQGRIGGQALKTIWNNGFKENRAKDFRHCSSHREKRI